MRRLVALAAGVAMLLTACGSGEAEASLVLSGTGFGLANLGDPFESVTDQVHARWGPPEQTRELGCESYATSRLLIWPGVLLVFNDRGLSGYLVGPRPADAITSVDKDLQDASTTEGLRIGDTVKTARDVYGTRFVLDETSLGPEWYIESGSDDHLDLRGFATGLGDAETVSRIGAGDICAVR